MIEIKIPDTHIRDVHQLLNWDNKKVNKVFTRSINKTLSTIKTQAAKRIGKEVTMKAARIKKDFSVKKATYANPKGFLKIRSRPPGAINFGKPSKVKKGVKYKVFRGQQKQLLKGGWIMSGKGGNKHIFRRKNNQVQSWYGPRIASIFEKEHIYNPVIKQAGDLIAQRIDDELMKVLKGF